MIPALKAFSIKPQLESENNKTRRLITGVYFLINLLLSETRKLRQWFTNLFNQPERTLTDKTLSLTEK